MTAVDSIVAVDTRMDDALLGQFHGAFSAMRRDPDPDHVLQLLTSTVSLVVPPDASVWAVRQSSSSGLSQAQSSGPAADPRWAVIDIDLAGLLTRWGERLGEGRPAFDLPAAEMPFVGAMAVPGEVTDTVFTLTSATGPGALVVSVPGRRLTTHERWLTTMLCDQAAMALDITCARMSVERTEALYAALTQLSASYSDSAGVLDAVVRCTTRLLKTDAAFVMMLDEEANLLRVRTAHGITGRTFYEVTTPPDELLPGIAIRRRRPVTVHDLQSDDQATYSKPEGLRSVVCAPMFLEDEVLGVLLAAHREAWHPSPADLRIMHALANAAAVAIGNARLHDRTRTSVSRLADVNALLVSRTEALERRIGFQQRLTSLVLAGGGLPDLVSEMSSTLQCFVQVLDRDLTVILQSDQATAGLTDEELDALRDAVASCPVPDGPMGLSRVPVQSGERDCGALIAPLQVAGELAAVVVVVGHSAPDTAELGMAEAAVTILGLELMRDRASTEAEARLTGGLLEGMLADDATDEGLLVRRASHLGFHLQGANAVVAIRVDQPDGGHHRIGQLGLEERMRRAVQRQSSRAPVFERDGVVYVVVSDAEEVTEHHIGAACGRIRDELAASGLRTKARIAHAGPHCGIPGLRRAIKEAGYALDVLGILGTRGTPTAFTDLGVWTLLGRVEDKQQLQTFAHSVLGGLMAHDEEQHSDLIATLRQLVRRNYHYRSAAEDLYVHPNTLRYRMSRIIETTGLDLEDADDRLRVELALRILDAMATGDGTATRDVA